MMMNSDNYGGALLCALISLMRLMNNGEDVNKRCHCVNGMSLSNKERGSRKARNLGI